METKTVYIIGIDKKYAGVLTLDNTDKSPSGRWNIPANCTELKPLEEKKGFNVAWNGISWEYVEIPQEPIEAEPTAEELQEQARQALDAEYTILFTDKDNEIIQASVILQDEEYAQKLRQERTALVQEYADKRSAL